MAVPVALAVVALGACSSGSPSGATSRLGSGGAAPTRALHIVAGENFWGSIAAQLAGRAGRVTSIVTDPNTDPHAYESSSNDARAFADADYVVLNGAGYDSWADKLLSGNPKATRRVTVVATVLGKNEGNNPHFWYSPDFVSTAIGRIVADLKALDPQDSAYFDRTRAAFDVTAAPYRHRLAEIKARFGGVPVGATESIVVYLADHLGLHLISPPEFMRAVAEGNDPPAATVAEFQDQIAHKQMKALVYNLQTSTAVTTNLKHLAAQQDIPTIGITETIQPPDASFQQWQEAELENLENALNANALSGAPVSG